MNATDLPYYPYRSIPKFYDIGTLLNSTNATKYIVERMSEVVSSLKPTIVGALDARGFLFGGMVAYHLNLRLGMVREAAKMPNGTEPVSYKSEHGERPGVCYQQHVFKECDRIVLVDDMVGTGGSIAAALESAKRHNLNIIGVVTILKLDMFNEIRQDVLGSYDIPVYSILNESQLNHPATLDDSYIDDGLQPDSMFKV